MGNTSSSGKNVPQDFQVSKAQGQLPVERLEEEKIGENISDIKPELPASTTAQSIASTEAGRHRILDADEISEATPEFGRDIITPGDETPAIKALLAESPLPPSLAGTPPSDIFKSNANRPSSQLGKALVEDSILETATPSPNASVNAATHLVPIVVTWNQGGSSVYVSGTFNEWKHKVPLSRADSDGSFKAVLYLQPGAHRIKFIVDDEWRFSNDMATATDGNGNLLNYIDVERKAVSESLMPNQKDTENFKVLSSVASDQSSSPDGSYTSRIPSFINSQLNLPNISPVGNPVISSLKSFPSPPHLPPQLQRVILNYPNQAIGGPVHRDDNSVLTTPNHVVLNHLAASSIRNGVLAMAITTRYRKKYVTTIFYKPVQL